MIQQTIHLEENHLFAVTLWVISEVNGVFKMPTRDFRDKRKTPWSLQSRRTCVAPFMPAASFCPFLRLTHPSAILLAEWWVRLSLAENDFTARRKGQEAQESQKWERAEPSRGAHPLVQLVPWKTFFQRRFAGLAWDGQAGAVSRQASEDGISDLRNVPSSSMRDPPLTSSAAWIMARSPSSYPSAILPHPSM